jgi:thiol-disulfide isomerase/thioredoxin
MGTARRWAANLDMYRKVPGDLLEGSKQGSAISWITLITIFVLFYKETADYFTTSIKSDLHLDRQVSMNDRIRVRFNITLMDLKCDYVQMDVVSVLGNNQNVTKSINTFPVDANGVLQRYGARNRKQHDVEELELHDKAVVKTIEQLHEVGEEAVPLDGHALEFALDTHELVFVDMYASWCSHCKALAPTWETLAKIMRDAAEEDMEEDDREEEDEEYKEAVKLNVPVFIGKVDCVDNRHLCMKQQITAYPTLRLFVNGQHAMDYRGSRTVMDFIQFLKVAEEDLKREGLLNLDLVGQYIKSHMNMSIEEKNWLDSLERTKKHHAIASGSSVESKWKPSDHPGCQIAGSILINRVPGNFYIQAFSPMHDLAPHMTNLSHEVHSLVFTPEVMEHERRNILPKRFEESTTPLNGNVYITENLHEAYHHYLKLVTTNGFAYQVLQSSQLAIYGHDQVPEAKFIIDLSPIAIRYRRETRPWYDYVTSLMAIIGGTFTVVGILEASMRQAGKMVKKKITKKKRPPQVPQPRTEPQHNPLHNPQYTHAK